MITIDGIVHYPLLDFHKVQKLYSEKDGVEVKYVCTSAIGGGTAAGDIFYRSTPHPEFGNSYFTLYLDPKTRITLHRSVRIASADVIEDLEFGMISNNEGLMEYSSHRWDYKRFNDCVIDGGRAYTRGWGITMYHIKDGKFILDKG